MSSNAPTFSESEGESSIAPDETGTDSPPPKLPSGWVVRGLSDAIEGADKQPPWVIESLLLSESATQISAHPHSMKSLAWLAAALEAPAKHKVWGHFDASAVDSTLFIETEDSAWVVENRLRGIAKGLGLKGTDDVPGFHYLRTGPFDLVGAEKCLSDIFAYYRPDFAVLSTLQNLLGARDWKSQENMQAVNALIVRLSMLCPIVEITHSPWDPKQRRAIGTISQAANFLTALHFEKIKRKSETFVHVAVDSKLGADVTDFTLRLETEAGEVRRFVYEGAGRPKGQGKEAVLDAIKECPDSSAKEIAEMCGVSERYVQQLRKRNSRK